MKKYFEIKEFETIDYTTNNITEIILDTIDNAIGVYVYRSFNDYEKVDNCVKWLKENSDEETNKIIIKETNFKNKNKIVAKNKESIYYLKFNKSNLSSFKKRFRIPIISLKSYQDCNNYKAFKNKEFLYTEDSTRDQYDYIFMKSDSKISLWTETHTFYFFRALY